MATVWCKHRCSAAHCNTLQHTATHCNTLQHTAIHCNTLRYTAIHTASHYHTQPYACSKTITTVWWPWLLYYTTRPVRVSVCLMTLYSIATHCNTLQHTATHCNTLQHTATHCNTLKQLVYASQLSAQLRQTAKHWNTLQHTASHATDCQTLQHTATGWHCYGVATISRLLKIIGLFWRT